jgi:hypothetical protein
MATNTSADTQAPPGNPNTRGCTEATRRNNGTYAADSTKTRPTMTAAAGVARLGKRRLDASLSPIVPASPIEDIVRRL